MIPVLDATADDGLAVLSQKKAKGHNRQHAGHVENVLGEEKLDRKYMHRGKTRLLESHGQRAKKLIKLSNSLLSRRRK